MAPPATPTPTLEFLLFLLRLVPLLLFSLCFSNMLAILEVLAVTSPAPPTFTLSDLAALAGII